MSSLQLPWPPAPDWQAWRHVTKLDPDRNHTPALLDAVLSSGTDAILLGGSSGMTQQAVADLLDRLRDSPIPVALEVSTVESAMPGASLFLIPFVLNTRNADWLGRAQAAALTRILPVYGPVIPWHLLLPEAYLVLNPNSTVARVTEADTALSPDGAAAYAALAAKVLRMPLIYVEYSGSFGELALLRAVRENAGKAHLFYGGGVVNGERARQAGAFADTVVVGNLVYADPGRLRETVDALRESRP